MNSYILSVIIFSILLIPISFASADELPYVEFRDAIFAPELYGGDTFHESNGIYIFVQVVQYDKDGNFISFLQSDKMTNLNPNTLNYYMNSREKLMEIPIYDFRGQLVQAYGEKFTDIQTIHDITASTLLVVEIPTPDGEIKRQLAARFAHDGLIMAPGDVMDTHWYVARLLD